MKANKSSISRSCSELSTKDRNTWIPTNTAKAATITGGILKIGSED
jgi:hypothetical protein